MYEKPSVGLAAICSSALVITGPVLTTCGCPRRGRNASPEAVPPAFFLLRERSRLLQVAVLDKHGNLDRFGLCLLHDHFRLAAGATP
ncbi:hypothetical protein GCM10010507_41120 [Streptomyces cinnamoneus]|uniref:Uncharacterized protein n=1 Tax=Streptomyces cinnamoneus TaxID=53446 RepID=A0A918TRD2_STRCJ|nr:hypothetical protein GCM10010507_41120 [Streptomyces cinnamoneus]